MSLMNGSKIDYAEKYMHVYREALGYTDKPSLNVKTVTFIVTEDCNLGCTYCYQLCKTKNKMTKETAKKAIDLLFEDDAKESHYINKENSEALIIDFIGGEPLMNVEVMQFIATYFMQKAISLRHRWAENVMFSISTNGTLYFSKKFQDFMKLFGTRLSVGITIDGNEELHDSCRFYKNSTKGSYKDVERAYLEYLKINPRAATKLTIAPENITYLYDGVRNCYENIGIKNIHSNCVYEKGWEEEHATILYEQLKKIADWIIEGDLENDIYFSLFDSSLGVPSTSEGNWCGGTGSMLAITPTGSLTPCLRYASYSLPKDVKPLLIGDIEKGIGYKEEYQNTIEELKSITRDSQSPKKCLECPISSGCGWCSAYNYEVYGTVNKRATFICCMHKARILANVYFWNKLYRKANLEERFPMNVPDEWALNIIDSEELSMLKQISES